MFTTAQAWIVWLIGAFFYAYQYMLRVIPNIMMDDIKQQFAIDDALYGQFSGIYYIGYALMHIPLGILFDRLGPKKIMPVCILLTVVGTLLLMGHHSFMIALLGRLLVGIGSSAAILGLFKIIQAGFPETRFTRMLSIAVTIGLLGAIYGGMPVTLLHAHYGFKTVIAGMAGVGVILAFFTFILTPTVGRVTLPLSLTAYGRAAFSSRKAIIVSILAGLMVGPLEGFADVWGAAFFEHVYHVEHITGASLTSLIFLGMCFGAPFLSLVAEKTRLPLVVLIGSALFMGGAFIALLKGALSNTLIGSLMVLIGVLSSYQVIAIYQASTYAKKEIAGLITAIANMIIMLFGYFFHSTIGKVISLTHSEHLDKAYVLGVSIIPLGLFLAAIGFSILFWNERKSTRPLI